MLQWNFLTKIKAKLVNRKGKHIVFYDGQCGFCDRSVQWILKKDTQKEFLFAPLQGQTAAKKLYDLPLKIRQQDSLILIENFSSTNKIIHTQGKAVFRIFWLLGGKWSIFGIFYFLPSFMYNWAYRFVAAYRKKISQVCILPSHEESERFLP